MTVLGRSSGLPEAIILDLDDTILDSGDPEVSWRRVSSEFAADFEGVVAGRLFDALIEARDWFWDSDVQAREGRLDLVAARRTIFARALSSLGAPDPDVATPDAMARRYTAPRDEAVAPFPGALEALGRLRSSGSKLALLTNGSSEKQWAKIRQFELATFFHYIQVEGDVGVGKPDPEAFRRVLTALDVAAEAAWMVGDNLLSDIRGAQRAGIYAIWIDAHGNGRVDGDDVTPARVVSSLHDLLDGGDPPGGS